MKTCHTTIHLAPHRLHRVDFDPATFSASDLLWLPHYAQLAHTGPKRQTEHLAGRIAAIHALSEYDEKRVPGMGEARQPLWPAGVYGSISHSETTALAVVSRQPVGVDIETLFTPALSDELTDSIVNTQEQRLLRAAPFPYPLALTVAFSAKESLFKAWSAIATPHPGFHSARVIAFGPNSLHLQPSATFSPHLAGQSLTFLWTKNAQQIITVTQ